MAVTAEAETNLSAAPMNPEASSRLVGEGIGWCRRRIYRGWCRIAGGEGVAIDVGAEARGSAPAPHESQA